MYRYLVYIIISTAILFSGTGMAADEARSDRMREDSEHVRDWNKFADEVYALHKKLVTGKEIKKVEKKGGYDGMPEFYNEVEYIDKKTGNLISRILWETENPDQIHVIEVNVYDNKNRVSRSYTAAFLPGYRNAPNQTLIHLYNYNDKKLKAFRTFDASGERIYEQCEGEYKGKQVWISLEDVDIAAAENTPTSIMFKPEYKACFTGLQKVCGDYVRPQ